MPGWLVNPSIEAAAWAAEQCWVWWSEVMEGRKWEVLVKPRLIDQCVWAGASQADAGKAAWGNRRCANPSSVLCAAGLWHNVLCSALALIASLTHLGSDYLIGLITAFNFHWPVCMWLDVPGLSIRAGFVYKWSCLGWCEKESETDLTLPSTPLTRLTAADGKIYKNSSSVPKLCVLST